MRTQVSSAVIIFILLCTGITAADEDIPVSATECRVTRERIEGIVNMFLTLRNDSDVKQKINFRIEFLTQLGDTIDKRYRKNIRLEPGKKMQVEIHEKRVQYFERYRVILEQKKKEKVFMGHVAVLALWEEPTEPLEGTWCVQVMGHDHYYIRKRATSFVKVKLKNYGELTATGVKVKISFFKAKQKKPLGTVVKPFDKGELEGWTEKAKVIKVVRAVPYDHVSVAVITDNPPAQEAGEGGFSTIPLTDKPVVEAGEFVLTTEKDKLIIKGKLRNGLSVPVKKVVVNFSLLDKKGGLMKACTIQAGDVVKPGQVVDFEATVENPPAFTTYEYNLTYKEVK